MVRLAKPRLFSCRPLCTGRPIYEAAITRYQRGQYVAAAALVKQALSRFLTAYMTWYAVDSPPADALGMIDALAKEYPSYKSTCRMLKDAVEIVEDVLALRCTPKDVCVPLDIVGMVFTESWLSRKGGAL